MTELIVFIPGMPIATDTQYELTFVLDEKAGAAEGRAKTDEMKSYIEEHGGTVSKEDLWGRRELAYPIKRNRSGFYVTLIMVLPSVELPALEQRMQFDVNVIRSLITKAYVDAQPGSLFPEEEQDPATPTKTGRPSEDKSSGEEMLRRSSGGRATKPGAEAKPEDDMNELEETLPEEERLKKLDETLDSLLKEDA